MSTLYQHSLLCIHSLIFIIFVFFLSSLFFFFFFFNDTATTEIYTLSLHDALPISARNRGFETSPAIRHASWWPRTRRVTGRSSPQARPALEQQDRPLPAQRNANSPGRPSPSLNCSAWRRRIRRVGPTTIPDPAGKRSPPACPFRA